MNAESVQGDWQLHIVDLASADVGRLLHWHLDMAVAAHGSGVFEDRTELNAPIPDADVTGVTSTLTQTQAGEVRDIVVDVDIEHTYIGDLQVELVAPSGYSVLLHDREGEWRNNLKRSYEVAATPPLQGIIGQSIPGDWQLRVRDMAQADLGKLKGWSLKIHY